MRPVYGLVLLVFLILLVFSTGCTDEESDGGASVPAGTPQPGVLIQTVGSVTGQGVILQGVPRGTIDTITFNIGLAPGVKTADLNGTTIAYSDSVRTEIFTPVEGYRGDPPAGYWGIVDSVNEMGSRTLRLDYEEQFVIRVNPKAPVVPNQVVTITVKPKGGKPLVIRAVAPSAIIESNNVMSGL